MAFAHLFQSNHPKHRLEAKTKRGAGVIKAKTANASRKPKILFIKTRTLTAHLNLVHHVARATPHRAKNYGSNPGKNLAQMGSSEQLNLPRNKTLLIRYVLMLNYGPQ